MSLHLIKLSVGPESLSQLVEWQTDRLAERKKKREPRELYHITRHMPKRREELLNGGSIYWVIKGYLVARQRLIDLRPVTRDEVAHCVIVYDPEMIRIQPRPHRPFQGWRYFNGKDAPPDLSKQGGMEEIPEAMLRELSASGLL